MEDILRELVDDERENYIKSDQLSSNISKLRQAWIDEKIAPELLPYKNELIIYIKKIIQKQKDYIDEQLETDSIKNSFTCTLYKIELRRIEYILISYLRIRLKKIEKFVVYLLEPKAKRYIKLLSKAEYNYAMDYLKMIEENFNTTFLRLIPSQYRRLDDPNMIVKPNIDQYIFVKVLSDLGEQYFDNEPVVLNHGDILAVKYKHFKGLLNSEQESDRDKFILI